MTVTLANGAGGAIGPAGATAAAAATGAASSGDALDARWSAPTAEGGLADADSVANVEGLGRSSLTIVAATDGFIAGLLSFGLLGAGPVTGPRIGSAAKFACLIVTAAPPSLAGASLTAGRMTYVF